MNSELSFGRAVSGEESLLLLIMGGEDREGGGGDGGGGEGGLDLLDPYLICDICTISGAESFTTWLVLTVDSLHLVEAGRRRMKPRARIMMAYWVGLL
mmetsp:Transcript_28600/g.62265  ORF Transcript_28600/g.62265 Transcript_28600/m.62265 type:complete len:98 (-) Transcript_28600:175-468(-)